MTHSQRERRRLRQLKTLNERFGGNWYWLTHLAERRLAAERIIQAAHAIAGVCYSAEVLLVHSREVIAWNGIRGAITCCPESWSAYPEIVNTAWPVEMLG